MKFLFAFFSFTFLLIAPVMAFVIDDLDPGYSETGTWSSFSHACGYNGDYRYETNSLQYAAWLTNITAITSDGYYEVSVHYCVHSARPDAVPYKIVYNNGASIATVNVDQTKDANGNSVTDFTASGWKSLGVYYFTANTIPSEYIELDTSDSGDTCADAVRFERSPLYVDDDGLCGGNIPCYTTIQAAINDAIDGDTILVYDGTYVEVSQIVISKNLTISGIDIRPIIKPAQDTGSSGDSRGWFLVNSDIKFDLNNVVLDGSGHKIWQAIRHKGQGTITNCNITNIKYDESGPNYSGTGIVAFGTGNVDISNCEFTQIGRVGVLYFGSTITNSIYKNNKYIGKGDGDWLDYGVEVGAGANAKIINSRILNNTGIASVDGSESAGILVTTFYGLGTQATITNNHISDSSAGIYVGYCRDVGDPAGCTVADSSLVNVHSNEIFRNDIGIFLGSNNNVNTDNEIYGNDIGVDIFGDNNTISGDVIYQNSIAGIIINSSSGYNKILDNFVHDNTDGIWVEGDNNEILRNRIKDNPETTGVHLTTTAANNKIWYNQFINNVPQAIDNGLNNSWDDMLKGNCWSDWRSNTGYPNYYLINDTAGSKDYHPCGTSARAIVYAKDGVLDWIETFAMFNSTKMSLTVSLSEKDGKLSGNIYLTITAVSGKKRIYVYLKMKPDNITAFNEKRIHVSCTGNLVKTIFEKGEDTLRIKETLEVDFDINNTKANVAGGHISDEILKITGMEVRKFNFIAR